MIKISPDSKQFFVYVLKSINHDKYYTGFTSDLEKRLLEHNMGKTKSNKAFAPFKIIYTEKCNSREEARKKEKYFKSAAGRRFLKTIGVR